MSDFTTLVELKNLLPSKRSYITQEAVDIINKSVDDPEFQGESLAQTAAVYESVLKGSRSSVPEYLNAIRFCAYITTNDSNYAEAYKKVFCDREFVKSRIGLPKDNPKYLEINSAASRYRRSKLVVDILTVSQVPLDMIFAGERYKALGVLSEIMTYGRMDKDRVNAAKELLAATKGPENVNIELDIGIKENSAVKQLNEQLAEIVSRQSEGLDSNKVSLEDLGSMKVIDADYSEVGKDE